MKYKITITLLTIIVLYALTGWVAQIIDIQQNKEEYKKICDEKEGHQQFMNTTPWKKTEQCKTKEGIYDYIKDGNTFKLIKFKKEGVWVTQ